MDERTSQDDRRTGHRPLLLMLGAVAAGLWLGQATVSAIDPFYRSGAAADGGSYTANGWEGANAIPAPRSEPERYVANPYVFPAVVVQPRQAPEVSPGWDDEPLPTREDFPADDRSSEWDDHECVDCGEAATRDGTEEREESWRGESWRDGSWSDQAIAARACGDGWSDCPDWPEDEASARAEF